MDVLSLQKRLERIEAVHEIENLIGRYAYLHVANMHEECYKLSATRTPGVRVSVPSGVYEGEEGLKRLYLGLFGRLDREPVGKMHLSAMTTPVIEIAEDLETAKGVWICPGHGTDFYGGDKLKALWVWHRFGCDFVKEKGHWKIWHLRIYGIFATPYEKSWVNSPKVSRESPPPLPPEFAPDRAPPRFWQYRQDEAVPKEPVPPEPFQTFDEDTAY